MRMNTKRVSEKKKDKLVKKGFEVAIVTDPKKIDIKDNPLSRELLRKMNAYWRAANYLSVGQLYLCDNPLLREPLKQSHIKSMLLGHWGTTPGQNFIYVHLNRVIKKYDLDMFYICLLYTSPSPRDGLLSRMPSSA